MSGGDVVRIAQRHCGADSGAFLADREMHGAVDKPAHVGLFRALLEAADEIHLAECFLELVGGILLVEGTGVRLDLAKGVLEAGPFSNGRGAAGAADSSQFLPYGPIRYF